MLAGESAAPVTSGYSKANPNWFVVALVPNMKSRLNSLNSASTRFSVKVDVLHKSNDNTLREFMNFCDILALCEGKKCVLTSESIFVAT